MCRFNSTGGGGVATFEQIVADDLTCHKFLVDLSKKVVFVLGSCRIEIQSFEDPDEDQDLVCFTLTVTPLIRVAIDWEHILFVYGDENDPTTIKLAQGHGTFSVLKSMLDTYRLITIGFRRDDESRENAC